MPLKASRHSNNVTKTNMKAFIYRQAHVHIYRQCVYCGKMLYNWKHLSTTFFIYLISVLDCFIRKIISEYA